MKVFVVLYQFPCPSCGRHNLNKKLFRAQTEMAANLRMNGVVFACKFCGKELPVGAQIGCNAVEASPEEAATSVIEPEPS